jgi:hypothetical protein
MIRLVIIIVSKLYMEMFESLRILKSGIEKSFDEAIGYIENEK